jgi:hypothetical protein
MASVQSVRTGRGHTRTRLCRPSVRNRTKPCAHMPKEYASFSSLIWSRSPAHIHGWAWKRYEVFGIGCDSRGLGGVWETNIDGHRYRTQFDAQAAVEHHDLSINPPEFLMDDVDLVWECLDQARTFDDLQAATRLTEGRLSDALARCYELKLLQMSILTGAVTYLRATKRAR